MGYYDVHCVEFGEISSADSLGVDFGRVMKIAIERKKYESLWMEIGSYHC